MFKHRGRVNFHHAYVLEKVLSLGEHGNSAIGSIEKPPLEDQFDVRDPPRDRRVIDLEDFRGAVNASLTPHFQDYSQIVPCEPGQLRHPECSCFTGERRASFERNIAALKDRFRRRKQAPAGAKTPNANA
jgi:hypothetical protein